MPVKVRTTTQEVKSPKAQAGRAAAPQRPPNRFPVKAANAASPSTASAAQSPCNGQARAGRQCVANSTTPSNPSKAQ
jgi:hypothetical protein